MTGTSVKPRAGFGIFTLVMVIGFVSLGIWQLQRRAEKHALIAALTERLAEAPGALPLPSQWGALTPARDEFRRVQFQATYESKPDAMVYSSGSAVREDISGPGTWAFLPAHLSSGETVVINAGFVPNPMQDRAQHDQAVKPLHADTPVMLTGYLRFPEKAGMLTLQENLGIILRWRASSAGEWSRRSTSTLSNPCLQAAFRNPARWESISRTITCNMPSPGFRWPARS